MSRKEIMSYYELENYYNEIEIDEAVKNPVFIHYTPAFVNRPWIEGCKHPLTPLYKSYLDMTPWKSTDLWKDRRGKAEKTIALLYTRLPFRIAHRIRNLIFK